MIFRYCYLSHNNAELALRNEIKNKYPQTLIYDFSLLANVRQSGDIAARLDRSISILPCFIIDTNDGLIEISRSDNSQTLTQITNAITQAAILEPNATTLVNVVDDTIPGGSRPIHIEELKELNNKETGIILIDADGKKWSLIVDIKGLLTTEQVV